MIVRYLLVLLSLAALFSCKKDTQNHGDTYIISARKVIALTDNTWSQVEKQLRKKRGYKSTKVPDNLSNFIKAVVNLKAIDDSNRNVAGDILINVLPNDVISFIDFYTDTIPQAVAYAMMLNYNNETLQTLPSISSSIGEIQENNLGRNTIVDSVLSRLISGQTVDVLAMTYYSGQKTFIIAAFRQSNGGYIFSYRALQ